MGSGKLPSPPADGGEGWGEEVLSAFSRACSPMFRSASAQAHRLKIPFDGPPITATLANRFSFSLYLFMPIYTWTAKDQAGKPVVREVESNSVQESKAVLAAE